MSEEIKNYVELEKEFEELFDSNCKNELSKNSKRGNYKPNPVISFKPDYCLIALEPALDEDKPKKRKSNKKHETFIDLLFMQSFNNLILQYCAYKFLCDGKFNYQITDVCKAPLSYSERPIMRKLIYHDWKKLLHRELELLNNPEIIPVGFTTEKYLLEYPNYNKNKVPHYSSNNNPLFKKLFNEMLEKKGQEVDFNDMEYININRQIKDFVFTDLIPHIKENFTKLNREFPIIDYDKLNKTFDDNQVADTHKVRYYFYKTLFSQISKNNNS